MHPKFTVRRMAVCAMMAAVMCVLCPLSIPIGPIPVSLQIFVLLLIAWLLGPWDAAISFIVYLALGAAGMPVFSGFQGGLAKLAGPTGGYLLGFLPMILIAGLFIRCSGEKFLPSVLGMVLGTAVAYFFGTVWFVIQAQCEVSYALSVCVLPFLPLDAVKIAAAAVLGKALTVSLRKAGVLKI